MKTLLWLVAACALAAGPSRARAAAPLPRVLLIGDSISFDYTPDVVANLRGQADVVRIAGTVAATVRPVGGLRLDTVAALQQLDTWLGTGHWDVIHFNWGLHDLKLEKDGSHQVPLDAYEKNLRVLVRRLQATGAKLIWASTTPVPGGITRGILRRQGDELAYNAAAARVMREAGIPIDDLHAAVAGRLGELQLTANVHFNARGYAVLGRSVSAAVAAQLKSITVK